VFYQDQDKLLSGGQKATRVETPEERQWKQIQALRQQQSQQQAAVVADATVKDPGGNLNPMSSGPGVVNIQQLPFQQGTVSQGKGYPPRVIGSDGTVLPHLPDGRMGHHVISPHVRLSQVSAQFLYHYCEFVPIY
jgi:predicted component of type VI protein secretion system